MNVSAITHHPSASTQALRTIATKIAFTIIATRLIEATYSLAPSCND
ncbi:hypothetical protein [Bradyrhizobium sp. B117]